MSIFEVVSLMAFGAAAYLRMRYEIRRYHAKYGYWRVRDLLYGPYSLDDQTVFEVVEDPGRFLFVEGDDDDDVYKSGFTYSYWDDDEDEDEEDDYDLSSSDEIQINWSGNYSEPTPAMRSMRETLLSLIRH
jgi:hypothetical protein